MHSCFLPSQARHNAHFSLSRANDPAVMVLLHPPFLPLPLPLPLHQWSSRDMTEERKRTENEYFQKNLSNEAIANFQGLTHFTGQVRAIAGAL